MSTSTTKPAIDNFSKWTTSCTSDAAQRREHRNNWIAFIIIIVFSLVSLCVAILMIFISQEGSVITHLEAKIYNVKFLRSMKNRTSKEFRNVSRPFCKEINKYFRSSHLSKMYQHCVVDRLRRGEKSNTTVEFRIRFKNPETFVNPYQVRDVILANSGRHRRNKYTYLSIGRFLILYKSLRIFLIRTSSTVPDILTRSKENSVDPEPNSVDYEADDYVDDYPLTTWTDGTSNSTTSENYQSTVEYRELTNSVTLREMSTKNTYDTVSSPIIPVASKGPPVNTEKRKGSNISSNRTSNSTNTTVVGSRHANNFNFADKTIPTLNSSTQIRNSSVGVKPVVTCDHQYKSDNPRLLNVGRESTASSQFETPTFSRVHVNGGTESGSKFILAGTTVAYLASHSLSTGLFMTKLTTAKSDDEQDITIYNGASYKDTTKGRGDTSIIGNHKSESENNISVFSGNLTYQNTSEFVNQYADIYNLISEYDNNEYVVNHTERLRAKTSHAENEDFTSISSTESWERHGGSTAGELERLWHGPMLSRDDQVRVNNSPPNVSFSNDNITWHREVNEDGRMGDNKAAGIDEGSTGGTEPITEVQIDTINSIMNYDIQVHSPETSLNFEVNDTVSPLYDEDILSGINSTSFYDTIMKNISNGRVKHNVSSRVGLNGYFMSSRLDTGIREGSTTVERYNGSLSHDNNSSTNNEGNNVSLSVIDSVYVQNPKQYYDSRSIENTPNIKHNSSFYIDRIGNEASSLSTAGTLEHYNKTNDISFNTEGIGNNESDVISVRYDDRLFNHEDAEHFNGTSSGAVVTRQFNRILSDSSYEEYFNDTQEHGVGLYKDMSLGGESNNRNIDTVYSSAETDTMLTDLNIRDNANDTTVDNEDRKLYNKLSLRGNKERTYQTTSSTITNTTTRYGDTSSVFGDGEDYKGSIFSTKTSAVTGTDSLERFRKVIQIRNQTLSHASSSGHNGTRSVLQNIEHHNNDSLSYTDGIGQYNETFSDSVGSAEYNSALFRVTSLHKITVLNNNNNSTNRYRNISDIIKDPSHKSLLIAVSLEDEQNNQSVSHRESLSLNERLDRTSTTSPPTSSVYINRGIAEWPRQHRTLSIRETQTGKPSIAEFETNKTLNLWTNRKFSNINNDNLTFPSTEASILQNKSDAFSGSIKMKVDNDISMFDLGDSLNSSNNRADLKYVSDEKNKTLLASTTTMNPTKHAAVTEKIDQITTTRTTSTETTMPKRGGRLLVFTNRKSRVNIKPSGSGWLAIRVDHTSRYFARETKRRVSSSTAPPTTTNSEYNSRFVTREHRVNGTYPSTKNGTQRESSIVALLKGAFLSSNTSQGVAVVTPRMRANVMTDVNTIIADVKHTSQLPSTQPTIRSSSPKMRLGIEPHPLLLNSRTINPVDNHTKSRQVLEEDTHIEAAVFRNETPSIHNQLNSSSKHEQEQDFKEFLLKTTSSYEYNDKRSIENTSDMKHSSALYKDRLGNETKDDSLSAAMALEHYNTSTNIPFNTEGIDNNNNIGNNNESNVFRIEYHDKLLSYEDAEPLNGISSVDVITRQSNRILNDSSYDEYFNNTQERIVEANITEGSGDILTNIRGPFAVEFRQNLSWTESNVQLNFLSSASTNMADASRDFRSDANNQLAMGGSANVDVNHTLNSFGNGQLTYNKANSTDYYETTNILDFNMRPTAPPILPTPVTTASENKTAIDDTSHEHADGSVEMQKSIKRLSELTPFVDTVQPKIRFEESPSPRNPVLSATVPIVTTVDSSLNNVTFSSSPKDVQKYISTILSIAKTIENKMNNIEQNNTIDNVKSSSDILSGIEDPLFEAYNSISDKSDSNDSRQSKIETSTSIHSQQLFAVSLTNESQHFRQNNTIQYLESMGDIPSRIEDPLFEAYNSISDKSDSNDSEQSKIETSTSIHSQQLFAVSLTNESQHFRQNNTIQNVESMGDIPSSIEDPLFEAYNSISDSNDSGQSKIETSTSIYSQQLFASQNFRNTTTSDGIIDSLSKQTTTFKNLVLNINSGTSMTNVSGKPKPDSRNKSPDHVSTKTGNKATTTVSISRTTSPILRLFVLEGKPLQNSSLKARTPTEAVLNRSSSVSSQRTALASPKRFLGNGTKDSVGATLIIDIKSAGSGWVKIPIIKTSKRADIDNRRTSTPSTTSKPFTNTSLTSTLFVSSIVPETTSSSTNIARLEYITPAFNTNPVASGNSDVLKRILMSTPASQTALTNSSFAAAKGLPLVKGYFKVANAPALNAPTSVTGTTQNGTSTEEHSTVKMDFTSIVGTESTSERQTVWPASESSTTFRISNSESSVQDLGPVATVRKVTFGHSTKQATKTATSTTSPSIKTTHPTSTVPSLTLGATTLTPTTETLATTLPLTTTPSPSTTTLATELHLTTMKPTTTTLATTTQPLTTTLPPTTTLATTLHLTNMQPTTTTLATTLPLTTTLSSTTTLTALPPTMIITPNPTTLATTLPLTTAPQPSTTTLLETTTLLPPTTSATTIVPPTTSLTPTPTTMTTLLLRAMTTTPSTTNVKFVALLPLTTPAPFRTTLSFATTLSPTTKITTLPTTIQRTTNTPQLTTTTPPPTTTSTLPPTTIASTTSTTTIPKTTFPPTTTMPPTTTTQPQTTQISTFSPTSTSTTAPLILPPVTTMIPSQTVMPVTSTAIQRLSANATPSSSSTVITAQTTSNAVTFAPAAFSISAGPTSTSPAPITTTTNPTTTEITVLNMTSVSGALYEPASIICTLIGPKMWTKIHLLLDQPTMNTSKVLATFRRASLSSETEDSTYSASLAIRGQVSRAKLIIERFQCDNQGLHVCRVDNGQLEEKINVYAKILTPDLPKIEVNDFVERRTTKVSCTGIVPFPNGDLDWKLNGRILRRNTKVKVDTTVGNCTKLLTKTFVGRFGRRLNGSELTCFESGSPQRFTSVKVQIVPSNFCEGRPINKVYSHPYTCNKYITCLDGYFLTSHCPGDLCYNAESNRCEEVNEPDPTSIAEKDVFSCIGKPTGQVVPNPDECTGYYLCVAGLRNIRRCPSHTYFTLTITGFCTFDYNQSYCASIGQKLPTK